MGVKEREIEVLLFLLKSLRFEDVWFYLLAVGGSETGLDGEAGSLGLRRARKGVLDAATFCSSKA